MKTEQPPLETSDFGKQIKDIRNQLTTKISFLSTLEPIDIETTKLLKEITSIVKELDKMVKENTSLTEEQNDTDTFIQMLREKSIINN